MDNVKLCGIHLDGFQSWDNLSVNIKDGLNIINADNGVGKSVILKALSISLNPESYTSYDRRDFIRFREDYSDIYYLFTDKVVFKITFTENNISYFMAVNNDLTSMKFMGNTPPKELLDHFGSIVKGNIITNLVSMDSSKLLIDSNLKDNHDLLSLLLTNEDFEKLLEMIEIRMPNYKKKLKEIDNFRSSYRGQLREEPNYDVQVKLDELDNGYTVFELIPSLLDMQDCFNTLDLSIKPLENSPNVCEGVQGISKILELAQSLEECKSVNGLEDLVDLVKNLLGMQKLLNSIEHVEIDYSLEELLNNLKSFSEISNELASMVKPLDIHNVNYMLNLITGYNKHNKEFKGILSYGDLKEQIQELTEEKDSYGGEVYECPIYGKIIYTNEGECIPSDY